MSGPLFPNYRSLLPVHYLYLGSWDGIDAYFNMLDEPGRRYGELPMFTPQTYTRYYLVTQHLVAKNPEMLHLRKEGFTTQELSRKFGPDVIDILLQKHKAFVEGPMRHSAFLQDVRMNPVINAIMNRWNDIAESVTSTGYLTGGSLIQTIWNIKSGRPAQEGINDYDIVYFDTESHGAEVSWVINNVQSRLRDLNIKIDLTNQTKTHLWYSRVNGVPYEPNTSAETAIDRFIVQAACVGIRPGEVYAPYGLEQIYGGVLRPNPKMPGDKLFQMKVESYTKRWPNLKAEELQTS